MKKRRCLFAAAAAALLLMSSAFAYGAEHEQYDFRNGKIEMTFPTGSTIEEIKRSSEAQTARDSGFEYILHTDINERDEPVMFDMYYFTQKSEEYIYFHGDKDEAYQYYDDYGINVINGFAEKISSDRLISLGKPEYYESEWVTYLRVNAVFEAGADGERYESLIYITGSSFEEALVSNMMIFTRHEGAYAESLEQTAKPVVDGFYDYGYDEELAGSAEASGGMIEDDGHDATAVFAWLSEAVILIAAVMGVKALKRRKRERTTKSTYKAKPGGKPLRNAFTEKRKDRANGQSEDFSRHDSEHTFARPADAESRYIESLETLLKSGLLTRREMTDMIDKHNRRIERRQGQ